MDAVITLSRGSIHGDVETRWALRSLFANYPQLGLVHVVGNIPGWLRSHPRLRTIPIAGPWGHCKDLNIIAKLLAVAASRDLGAHFIRMSDDQLILRPVTACDFVARWGSEPAPESEKPWDATWRSGAAMLRAAGFPARNFETHTPVAYRRDEIHRTFLRWPYTRGDGCTVNTLYFNTLRVPGIRLESGVRAGFYRKGVVEALDSLGSHLFASYNDAALESPAWARAVEQMFPWPSPFE